jgi:hypothetical protein
MDIGIGVQLGHYQIIARLGAHRDGTVRDGCTVGCLTCGRLPLLENWRVMNSFRQRGY